jgi:type II secretory pathway component PulF
MSFPFRSFGVSVVMIVTALVLAQFVRQFEDKIYLIGLSNYVHIVCWILLVGGLGLTGYNLICLWRVYSENREKQCFTCGTPIHLKLGRHVRYLNCWNCGSSQSSS